MEWEASLPHEQEVKLKGNAITQTYYTQRLLPTYIEAIYQLRLENPEAWVLQEENDPSHGTRKDGIAQQLKEANWITTITHPAQSPDLNPIEAI